MKMISEVDTGKMRQDVAALFEEGVDGVKIGPERVADYIQSRLKVAYGKMTVRHVRQPSGTEEFAPGEFRAIVNLLNGFLYDLAPDAEAEVVQIPSSILSALMALANSFVPTNEEENMELTYIKEALKCQSDTLS